MEITACFPACFWLRFASRPWSLASVRLLPSERLTPSSILSLLAHVSLLCHWCPQATASWQDGAAPLLPPVGAHWEVWSDISTHGADRCPPPHLPPPPSTPSLHHPASHCSSPPRGSHTTARSTGQTARHCALRAVSALPACGPRCWRLGRSKTTGLSSDGCGGL